MSVSGRFVVAGLVMAAVLAGLVACGAKRHDDKDSPLIATLQANAASLRSAGGKGPGFVCSGDSSGNVACVCDDNADSDSIYSCLGMEKICNLLGTGSLCNPSSGWCYCLGH